MRDGLQGRYDLALSIQLRLRSPKVFDFIRAHGLLPQLPSRVPQLLRIDASQAIHLLVEEREAVSPSAVVPAIQVWVSFSNEAAALVCKAETVHVPPHPHPPSSPHMLLPRPSTSLWRNGILLSGPHLHMISMSAQALHGPPPPPSPAARARARHWAVHMHLHTATIYRVQVVPSCCGGSGQ